MSAIKSAKEEMQKRYAQLESELNDLELKTLNAKFKALEARDAAARKLRDSVSSLKERTEEARKKISEFSEDSAGAWEKFQAGMETAWHDLSTAFREARQEYRNCTSDEECPPAEACTPGTSQHAPSPSASRDRHATTS